MISISANQWIRADRELPKKNQTVLVCDIFPGEQTRAHLVTFTGQLEKEWHHELSGKAFPQHTFTYWIPLQITFPKFTPEQEIKEFQDLLNTVKPGAQLIVDLSGTLSKDYVEKQVKARAIIEQIGYNINLSTNGESLVIDFFE